MKLSRFGPKSRTVFIASIVLLALAISGTAFGRELRVYPTATSGVVDEADLLNCASGAAPIAFGPDAGYTAQPGDTCVLAPGTYSLTPVDTDADGVFGPVVVTLANLTIRSTNGAAVTIIDGATFGMGDHAVVIQADGVTIGGPDKDQGVRITGFALLLPATDAINVGGFARTGPFAFFPTPPGAADENITIQNNIIDINAFGVFGAGINVVTVGSVENFTFLNNTISTNFGHGIRFANIGAVGRRGEDRNVVIQGNTLRANGVNNITFVNVGTIEQVGILDNTINTAVVNGLFIGPAVTEVRNMVISGNMIQDNGTPPFGVGGFGIVFTNLGRIEELNIFGNRGATASQGITGNAFGGILFGNGADIRDSWIENNAINSNGNLFPFGTGIFVLNPGDFEGVEVKGNDFRQNNSQFAFLQLGAGFLKLAFTTNDFADTTFQNNTFYGNAGFGGAFVLQFGRIDNIAFSNNMFRANGTFFLSAGVGLFSLFNDVSQISFTNDEFYKNFSGIWLTSVTGDMSEISSNKVISNEAQGPLAIGVVSALGVGTGLTIQSYIGDLDNITIADSVFTNNAGPGGWIRAIIPALGLVLPGDVDNVRVTNSKFDYNGTRAPIGLGSGLAIEGQSVRNVTIDPSTANWNNDHGVQITSGRDIMDISITESEFSGNDRNADTVGDGISLNASQNLSDVTIDGNKASGNNTGIRVNAQDRVGRNVTISDNSEIDNNRTAGIAIFGARDFADTSVTGNMLHGNATGLSIIVNQNGSDIDVASNKIYGADGTGTGVLLDSTGVSLHENVVRRNATGILVQKAADSGIHNNNIARNEDFGIDARPLTPGTSIDAKNNWWGEPSGPKHATNPNGIGDRVSDKVVFDPWLGEPAVGTDVNFEILSFTGPTTADKGVAIQYVGQIKNTGTEEGTQEIKLTVTKKADGTVVGVKSVTKTINPQAATSVTFDYKFTEGGDFTVKLETQDDSKSIDVHVTGAIFLTIEQAVAQHSGSPTIIEDPDITWAVELWVEDTIVPGTDGLRISDAKILELVGMWIDGTPVAMAAGQAAQPKKGFNLFEWLGSFFAARSAVEINHQASPSRVAPGESFTVTVAFNGEVKGLLLTESLPASWTITPLDNGAAFYKPSQQKWLVLGAGTVSYRVTVPAGTLPGSYTIAGSYTTSDGTGAVKPLTVEVAGAPVALKVEAVKFTGSRFVVEGVGVASVEARVWNLAGSLVFAGKANGNALAVNGGAWANGVYLYAVTVRGADGKVVQTEVRKLVVLR